MSRCDHGFSRLFLGPMPEKVLDSLKKSYERRGNVDLEADEEQAFAAPHLVKEHAFSFFVREGGSAEEWDDRVQKNMRKNMMDRWRNSDWGKALRDRAKERESTDRWIGTSFEIGNFLGLNLMISAHPVIDGIQPSAGPSQFLGALEQTPPGVLPPGSFSRSDPALPVAGPSSDLNLNGSSISKDLRKTVSLSEPSKPSVDAEVRVTHNVPEDNTHCGNFLDPQENDTVMSAEASFAPLLPDNGPDDGILKDRMLVQVYYSETNLSTRQFDEEFHRTARDLEFEARGEYLVALRKTQIELYGDYGFPFREWLSGHKRLAFVIPIGTLTRLSIYSFVDLTFCLTYSAEDAVPDRARMRWGPLFYREGSKIFIFRLRSRSRAYEWIWKLWLQLGGRLPKAMEIKNPTLNASVTIDILETNNKDIEGAYEAFNRENLIRLCIETLSSVHDWSGLIQREIANGKQVALAWRVGAYLDWVWPETGVDGKARRWAVLCGLAVRESLKSASLEVRLADHTPTHIHLRNGNKVEEPPGIEGYLKQIRPNSTFKHSVYLSIHDGSLFVLPIHHTYPPSPPGFLPHDPYSPIAEVKTPRQAEIWRGALQIMHASGVCDLRNVLAIRRAFQLVPVSVHDEHREDNDGNDFLTEAPPEDNEDGGNDGDSKVLTHMRRSFELLLKNGHVVRFEAHSRRLAVDWINRLRSLVFYWTRRHYSDAQNEMELAQASRARLTPRIRYCERGTHLSSAFPDLSVMSTPSRIFNWCVLEGCRPIVRYGKLFMKKGLRGQYRFVQMYLIPNHLVQYRIRPNSVLHSAFKRVCLSDAYVYSGYAASLSLPEGEYDPSEPPAGRRYRDGLETDDGDEDTMFVIHYRPHPRTVQDVLYHTDVVAGVPPLSSKRKTLMFRSRSKLERDSWCWAINCEIEKAIRIRKDREDAIRNSGNMIPSRQS